MSYYIDIKHKGAYNTESSTVYASAASTTSKEVAEFLGTAAECAEHYYTYVSIGYQQSVGASPDGTLALGGKKPTVVGINTYAFGGFFGLGGNGSEIQINGDVTILRNDSAYMPGTEAIQFNDIPITVKSGGTLTLSNAKLTNSRIYVESGGKLRLSDCAFDGGSAENGGAIFLETAKSSGEEVLIAESCTFQNATATGSTIGDPTALTAWEELITIRDGHLYYGGEKANSSLRDGAIYYDEDENETIKFDDFTFSDEPKQFAMVNSKLVIYPDEVYLDLSEDGDGTKNIYPLFAAGVGRSLGFSSTNTMTMHYAAKCGFKAGDRVVIKDMMRYNASGGVVSDLDTFGDNLGVEFTIASITPSAESGSKSMDTIVAEGEPFTAASFKDLTYGCLRLTLEVVHPKLDYICESENRLCGCSSDDQTIYVSALGDPSNFYAFNGTDADSYSVAVGTAGRFTGCRKYSTSVTFWKEDKLHKLLGSYPSEYVIYSYDVCGVMDGSNKSLCPVGDTLYYLGKGGVYAYRGATPNLVSSVFGQKTFTDGVAGADASRYYLSAKDGEETALLVYDTRTGIWLKEDETRAVDFASVGNDLYCLDDSGAVWLMDSGTEDEKIEWRAQFAPFYESIHGRKCYSRLLLRVEIPEGGELTAELRYDGKVWKKCGKVHGKKNDVIPIRIAVNRCDKFELRLSGRGACTILSLLREFSVRSDV